MVQGIKFKVTCDTAKVLERVKEHRAIHAGMVAEARVGYRRAATAALKARLGELEEGRTVSLHFQLRPPQDHTHVYDTAIGMLSAHQDPVVVLEASEYRNLMEDVWDWSPHFAMANAGYSPSTQHWSEGKGLGSFDLIGAP